MHVHVYVCRENWILSPPMDKKGQLVSCLHISGGEVNIPLELLAQCSDDGQPNAFVTSSDDGNLAWHDCGGREIREQKLHNSKNTPSWHTVTSNLSKKLIPKGNNADILSQRTSILDLDD